MGCHLWDSFCPPYMGYISVKMGVLKLGPNMSVRYRGYQNNDKFNLDCCKNKIIKTNSSIYWKYIKAKDEVEWKLKVTPKRHQRRRRRNWSSISRQKQHQPSLCQKERRFLHEKSTLQSTTKTDTIHIHEISTNIGGWE